MGGAIRSPRPRAPVEQGPNGNGNFEDLAIALASPALEILFSAIFAQCVLEGQRTQEPLAQRLTCDIDYLDSNARIHKSPWRLAFSYPCSNERLLPIATLPPNALNDFFPDLPRPDRGQHFDRKLCMSGYPVSRACPTQETLRLLIPELYPNACCFYPHQNSPPSGHRRAKRSSIKILPTSLPLTRSWPACAFLTNPCRILHCLPIAIQKLDKPRCGLFSKLTLCPLLALIVRAEALMGLWRFKVLQTDVSPSKPYCIAVNHACGGGGSFLSAGTDVKLDYDWFRLWNDHRL